VENLINKIYKSRNKFKRRYQVYLYETIMEAMKRNSKEILGKESVSLFLFVSGCIILGKLGMKFDFLTEKDRSYIKKLHRRITYNN